MTAPHSAPSGAAPTPSRPDVPPGPRSSVPGQIALLMSRDPLSFLTAVAARYGDLTHFSVGAEQIYVVAHPDLVRELLVVNQRSLSKGTGLQRVKSILGEGLLTSEGPLHLRQRRLIQPAFGRDHIARYGEVMCEVARARRDGWREGDIDALDEMMRITLSVVGRTLFGTDLTGESAELGSAVGMALEAVEATMLLPIDEVADTPIPAVERFRAARERLDRTIYRIIAERRASGEDRGDLLSMLIHALDVEGDGGGMHDGQLRDEIMTLFVAGHETTSTALSWSWYLLAQHPDVERRVHDEIDRVTAGRDPTPADYPDLVYVRQVVAEAMRLYPPVWTLTRSAREPIQLGGHVVPAGATILAPQWVVHRDARWWPDPLRFDPDRWAPDHPDAAARPKHAYFPFGTGARLCVGEHFAWMEAVLVLATVAKRWRMRLEPGQKVAPKPLLTLRPAPGLRMRLEARAERRPGS